MPDPNQPPGFSRRSFMKTVGVSATVTTLSGIAEAHALAREQEAGDQLLGPGPISIVFTVNGKSAEMRVEPSTTLAEALRFQLGLTGTKVICDRGACGGCSVIVNGKLANACMMLVIDAQGASITTIEGIAKGGKLDPVQESYLRHDALQCGYCTPGFIVATRVLLDDVPKPTLDQIKKALGGNICRCGTYTNIFNAALEASGQAPIMDQKGVA